MAKVELHLFESSDFQGEDSLEIVIKTRVFSLATSMLYKISKEPTCVSVYSNYPIAIYTVYTLYVYSNGQK